MRRLERLCYFFGDCWSELGKPVVMRCVRTVACLVWLVLLDLASSARLLRRSLSDHPEARCRTGRADPSLLYIAGAMTDPLEHITTTRSAGAS